MTLRILLSFALLAGATTAHSGDVCTEKASACDAKPETLAWGERKLLPLGEAFERLVSGGSCDYVACQCQSAGLSEGEACGGLSWGLSTRAAQDADAFDALGPKVRAAFVADSASAELRGRLVDVLAQVPTQCSAKLAAELFASQPEAFSAGQVLALAETGAQVFKQAVKSRVAAQRKADASVDVYLAAFLVRHGSHDADLNQLVREAAAGSLGGEMHAVKARFVASLALVAMGRSESWTATVGEVQRQALLALDAGKLERARDLALYLQFFGGLHAEKGYASFGYVGDRAFWHVHESGPKYANADQVFRLIEEVART